MSFVTLILIKERKLTIISAHYRVIKRIIEYCDFGIEIVKSTNKTEIDAGYLLIDIDNKVVIDAQCAFYTSNLLNEFKKVIL